VGEWSDRVYRRSAGSVGARLRLSGSVVLVVGRGAAAEAVAGRLTAAGAEVRAVAGCLADAPGPPEDAAFTSAALDGVSLVVAASASPLADRWVVRESSRRNIPVACVRAPETGTVDLTEAAEVAGVRVDVRTGDQRLDRDALGRVLAAIPARYERLGAWLARVERSVHRAIPDTARRRRLWDRLLAGPVAELVLRGHAQRADGALAAVLAGDSACAAGDVYLIGGGPGDPDLLTVRALRLLRQADVVLYDRLVAPEIVALARDDAERVYVGKQPDRHPVPQQRINGLLVEYARRGLRVARVKGGDPFIFGRGGEEIDSLMEEGIAFEVVPGITAASGCAAYAGIPLTHRDHAQSCVFVTGHRKANGELALDFDRLVRPGQTVVFYMGLKGLEQLTDGLIRHGMAPCTPAALVQQGTTDNQRVVSGTVGDIAALALEAGARAPTLVIVGTVVRLRERLAWFEPDPAHGDVNRFAARAQTKKARRE